jgi:hypothetical protein
MDTGDIVVALLSFSRLACWVWDHRPKRKDVPPPEPHYTPPNA